jgi:hypothetical protein
MINLINARLVPPSRFCVMSSFPRITNNEFPRIIKENLFCRILKISRLKETCLSVELNVLMFTPQCCIDIPKLPVLVARIAHTRARARVHTHTHTHSIYTHACCMKVQVRDNQRFPHFNGETRLRSLSVIEYFLFAISFHVLSRLNRSSRYR